ncbi:MAG: EthD family reductase [Woeseia sp.]
MFKIRGTYLPKPGMHFDLDYYFRVHVPLAQQQTAGRLRIQKVEVETHTAPLLGPDEPSTPCVFCVYLPEKEDLESFRQFLTSPHADPLKEDVIRYTNCDLQWTVCQVHEG